MKFLSLLILLAVAAILPFQVDAQVVPGSTWENGRGSVLTIVTVNPDGSFTGTYVNNAPGFGCQGQPGFPAVGSQNANAIGWTVSWNNGVEDCKSVTSWAGVILSTNVIEAFWSLGYTSAQYGPRAMVGTDFFSNTNP